MDSLSSLAAAPAGQLIRDFVSHLVSPKGSSEAAAASTASADAVGVGLNALDAFLQANVTGPVLPANLCAPIEKHFVDAWSEQGEKTQQDPPGLEKLRKNCLRHLEVDGVSPYALIPHLELFCLARYVFGTVLNDEASTVIDIPSPDGTAKVSIAWMRLRVNVCHYKLLTQPSLGPGSNFARSSQWSDVPSLETLILDGMDAVRSQLLGGEIWADNEESWATEDKAKFLVEAANNYILLGRSDKAKEVLAEATQTTGLLYALSGALGKRTKFQEKSVSQLVVLARSTDGSALPAASTNEAKPDALELNDDTLLEQIEFNKKNGDSTSKADSLPDALASLEPDNQPQLNALDQIILLTEATLKDAFSPTDDLTSEEVLPFAVRVLGDKSTNWQIYTQALLVRSRIETHRSRTVERGVLQLQAVADQVMADTTSQDAVEESAKENGETDIPSIQITEHSKDTAIAPPVDKPSTFLPAPKPSESAPAPVRLRYIHALCAPPRWHLESELAYAWAGVGSLVSALEIFKRLRLWAEVALCLASSAAADDEDGRGSGGDEKAKGIIRWRLFHRTGESPSPDSEPDDDVPAADVTLLKAADFSGPERSPPPPNAARLWCILGDLENDPAHYERAWAISNNRFARAQRSLGEYYLQQKDWEKALDAYTKATAANRFSPDMWGRLGDINLRLGKFDAAADAFTHSISSATDTAGGEDARTWSNLGSALWSQYCEVTAEDKTTDGADESSKETSNIVPSALLARSLAAFKKGASLAHDNWRIWDNVVTLASRVSPPVIPDMILALKNVIRIRQSEEALDTDLLTALLQDAVLSKDKEPGTDIYEPPRGSHERLVTLILEDEIVPLITYRNELWTLISRLRAWRRDYAGAVDAAERAWRAAVGSSGSSLLPGAGLDESSGPSRDWTTDKAAWEDVVKRTDELSSALETWGPDVETIGIKWKGRVRSAVRTVMSRGRESWEDSEEWKTLENIMEGLKSDR